MGGGLKGARGLAGGAKAKPVIYRARVAPRPRAGRTEGLTTWRGAGPLPKPLFVGIAAGHAAARKMSAEQAVAKLGAAGIAAFTDPIAMVRAVAQALGAKP